jgi:hypothetical protein
LRRVLPFLAATVVVVGFVNFFWSVGVSGGLRPIPLWITHPLTLLGMAYLLFQFVFPAALRRQSATEAVEREQALRASGPQLAAANPGGQIGNLNMSRGLLAVRVYPGGILLKPIFMKPAAILKLEITSFHVKKTLWGGRYVELTYTSSAINSPLILYASPESDIARAIEQIAGMPLAFP